MTEPKPDRAHFPEDYGVPADGALLDWEVVEQRMAEAPHYWLATVGPDRAPHTRPIAGMWLERKLYFGGSPKTRWLQNLTANPRVCVNLSEVGEQAVILHGEVVIVRPDRTLAERLVAASNEKYAAGQRTEEYEGEPICVFAPKEVYAWHELKDATRWRL